MCVNRIFSSTGTPSSPRQSYWDWAALRCGRPNAPTSPSQETHRLPRRAKRAPTSSTSTLESSFSSSSRRVCGGTSCRHSSLGRTPPQVGTGLCCVSVQQSYTTRTGIRCSIDASCSSTNNRYTTVKKNPIL